MEYSLKTPERAGRELATRARAVRLAKGFKQTTLAERAGVSLASLRRFERTGKVSLESLLKIAFALHHLDDFDAVFEKPRASSIAELEALEKRPERQRGRL